MTIKYVKANKKEEKILQCQVDQTPSLFDNKIKNKTKLYNKEIDQDQDQTVVKVINLLEGKKQKVQTTIK